MSMSPFSRRGFLSAAVAGGAAAGTSQFAAAATEGDVKPGEFREPSRDIPLADDADVIVCGAGPAGVTAAIMAARAGCACDCSNGAAASAAFGRPASSAISSTSANPALPKSCASNSTSATARAKTVSASRFCYDPEALKLLLEELCVEAGVKFQYHTKVSAAFREGNRLSTIVTESKSGREAWKAPVFIDTTGDGDLGYHAGCGFEIGLSDDCPCQPMSLNALLVVKDAEALREFIRFGKPNPGENSDGEKKKRIRDVLVKTGHYPSYAGPTMWHVRDNLVFAMMNHEYGIKAWDAAEITAATVRARAEMNKMVAGLRGLGGPWEGIHIVATAEQIGVRDGRRIRGRYTVLQDDLAAGIRHEDSVVRVTFGIDVHARAPNTIRSTP
ncbi:MAG: FAD-dependent oxidoreductase [Pirellulales bacterium]